MSSALDHSAPFAILKYSFNSGGVTLSRKVNLEIDIRHIDMIQIGFQILSEFMMDFISC